MIGDELIFQIEQHFGHVPTEEQRQALRLFADFMTDRGLQAGDSSTSRHRGGIGDAVMILRGSAGTGKTTLAAAIVRGLLALNQKLVLMAPTGRAAKVFANYSGHDAHTIHRRIYRQKTAGDMSAFSLNVNLSTDTLFVVDEASMISSRGGNEIFGSGSLLDDLIQFVYNGQNCRLLLIGDKAQLPPVGETESPALTAGVLRGYGLRVYETDLVEVLRQSQESGILWNATKIREYESTISSQFTVHSSQAPSSLLLPPSSPVPPPSSLLLPPKIKTAGFSDICRMPGDELIESLASSYSRVGMDETMVVTRSNKRANIYNQGIRNTVLDREDELCRGDHIMIVKNNYSLTPNPSPKERGVYSSATNNSCNGSIYSPLLGRWVGGEAPSFIANGDMAVVQRVRNIHSLYGFRFAEVTMTFPDYNDYELTAMVLLDTLTSEAPALTREQQEQLYERVMDDYQDIPFKADRLKKIKEDKYYNALQIKFAYAATCHKTQGGQWAHIYIDQGYITEDMLTSDYYHWLYTALTRATEKVFLVNWPEEFTVQSS